MDQCFSLEDAHEDSVGNTGPNEEVEVLAEEVVEESEKGEGDEEEIWHFSDLRYSSDHGILSWIV